MLVCVLITQIYGTVKSESVRAVNSVSEGGFLQLKKRRKCVKEVARIRINVAEKTSHSDASACVIISPFSCSRALFQTYSL